jgi:hypothetical protein
MEKNRCIVVRLRRGSFLPLGKNLVIFAISTSLFFFENFSMFKKYFLKLNMTVLAITYNTELFCLLIGTRQGCFILKIATDQIDQIKNTTTDQIDQIKNTTTTAQPSMVP